MAFAERLEADMAFWQRVAVSYARLGSEFRDVPITAARLFHGRDAYGVKTALVFYRSAVSVMRRWGIWDPRQARLATPDFRSTA
jgi:hypothetical protein